MRGRCAGKTLGLSLVGRLGEVGWLPSAKPRPFPPKAPSVAALSEVSLAMWAQKARRQFRRERAQRAKDRGNDQAQEQMEEDPA